MILFIKGLFIGFLLAVPLGPAGAVSVRRALERGPVAGFLSGLGTSAADVVYLAILEYGASSILPAFDADLMRVVSGTAVIYVGLRLFFATGLRNSVEPRQAMYLSGANNTGAFLSSFLLSIVNPSIIVSLAILLNAFQLNAANRHNRSAPVLIAAVFAGSALLWLLMVSGVGYIRITRATSRRIGVVFVSLGLTLIALALGATATR